MNVENNFASFWIQNGILHFTYKKDVTIDLTAAMQIVTDRLQLQKGKFYPILCDTRGVKSIDMNARRYLAREGTVFIKAVAFVQDNPLSRIFSEIYVQGNRPPIPTKICDDTKVALRFLNEYVSS
ncbi:hypothetical protein HX109_10685 [Galbibacter sp. BG1]|uniref:DUF7793 family protein n=1 Tax=Galbibacter sp. BG1 TaxID=1170699 RepID=UPI0015B7AD91|nr:hypothetical protein [Galbibacter sp. BG1]QLE01996.1 hypothetical protein HX109_10685 [Galbibacter sp. BG1]